MNSVPNPRRNAEWGQTLHHHLRAGIRTGFDRDVGFQDLTPGRPRERRHTAGPRWLAIALNNLAYLLGKDPARLDEAVALAERAYGAAPRSPAVADTLGWLLYKNGALERAETLLTQATGGAPDNPEIRYHLGLVYAKRDKKAEARREIERALEAPNFAAADEARRVLDTLR